MNIKTVVHIGFPKTGTTTHQKHLFAKHSQVKYLGKPYESESFKQLILDLTMQESLIYDPTPLKEVVTIAKAEQEHQGKNTLILSDEILVSASKVRDKGLVAQRIKEIFHPCKILITLRNQLDTLKSAYINGGLYLFMVPDKYAHQVMTFEEWLTVSTRKYHGSYIENVVYIDLIEYYVKLFGKENVCLLLFEEFKQDKSEYISKLSRFLGIDVKESMSLLADAHENKRLDQKELDARLVKAKHVSSGNPVLSRLKSLTGGLKGGSGNADSVQAEFPPEWKTRLIEKYKPGNRKLIEQYQLPLEKYGYPV